MWTEYNGRQAIYERPDENGIKLYPIPLKKYVYKSYKIINGLKKDKIYSLGRLGKYEYLNMDEAIMDAISFADVLLKGGV